MAYWNQTFDEQKLMESVAIQVRIAPMSPIRRWVGIALVRLARWVLGCKSDIWAEVVGPADDKPGRAISRREALQIAHDILERAERERREAAE